MGYLLDTNIVSASLKQNVKINLKLQEVSSLKIEIAISGITYYEIQRGLLRSNATKKLAWFQEFCQDYPILFLDDLRIFQKASEIHADLTNRGKIIQDADILIAATAIIHNLILVSPDSDLTRVKDLQLENWLIS
ncbi:PIN domain-containing protein [Anabaena cylindrica FACHB-243]|uniref:PilT protein domain protein n=1 Tax=Anabaena cylindrica (strain ATCC 27899 / PCC 7122) TaxID=272123 RepID=K9ZPY3_ANACC|nr:MULTISPECIES: PIN domain-containing protein [Anabaena]AFZ60859.1 PilT protein domain protein [Anabaena cylindrica PCC 7122]MBD2420520.1 PIN domain-containing protein [Anabaena cylindrica FACHB-243]MBY5284662.1 type II toxin-antitoxin system VapC family toxin [Anabaena sp. CCAP 1446/1C]MBY5309703.1 type II toxin-antitoxin system VapC family toxin [Anabaena sp. CCAP 1446/1C]MCM2406855.1 PIN domain-containing protein [Anabaena sp. CCAP 1446/1C]